MNSTAVMQPLMEFIESSNEKWECVPSEYENLKDYYARMHDESLTGYDEWFNKHFTIIQPTPVLLKEGIPYDLGGKVMTLEEIRECVIDSDIFRKEFRKLMEESQ